MSSLDGISPWQSKEFLQTGDGTKHLTHESYARQVRWSTDRVRLQLTHDSKVANCNEQKTKPQSRQWYTALFYIICNHKNSSGLELIAQRT
jgi:hypothetical protein